MKTPIRHDMQLKYINTLKFYEFVPCKEYLTIYESYLSLKNTMDINNCILFL